MNIEPVYVVESGGMTIDAPTAEVWRLVLDYPSWQNFPVVQHVSGDPGGEGEVVLLRKEEKGFVFPSYYARTIKLQPQRRVIWKTYPEKQSPESNFFGIVEFRLDDRQGKTLFSYTLLYEFMVSYTDKSELDAFREKERENFKTLSTVIFPKLKALAEKSGSARHSS
jgi:uncharacterized protein YndB with AHSA1/START domain